MSDKYRGFWVGFVVGVGATLAALVVAIVVFATLLTGPQLAVQVEMPDSVARGDTFVVLIEASNPHDREVELDNIDIPDRVLESFQFVSVNVPTSGEPLGGLGTETWFFDLTVPSGSRETLEFDVKAIRAGSAVMQFDVCNAYEVCTTIVRPINIS
jgi:hypothetical protein